MIVSMISIMSIHHKKIDWEIDIEYYNKRDCKNDGSIDCHGIPCYQQDPLCKPGADAKSGKGHL